MTDMYLLYRDLLLPAPKWEEQGVFGGYRWIALDETDSVWLSRKWEPYLIAYTELRDGTMKLKCGCECMRQFKDLMHDASIMLGHTPSYWDKNISSAHELITVVNTKKYATDFIYPEQAHKDDYIKIKRIAKLQGAVAIAGYSSRIAQVVEELQIDSIYSSSPLLGNECYTEEEILKMTAYMKVFIPHGKLYLKQHVCNWANVITI